jgi:pimeloyl-ACP methyl ester carboxylesterase
MFDLCASTDTANSIYHDIRNTSCQSRRWLTVDYEILESECKFRYRTSDSIILCGVFNEFRDGAPKGAAILVHGLNNDKDEDGSFVKLSESLNNVGYDALRFDFRGHGESGGKTEDVTISGELFDLERSISVLDALSGTASRLVIISSSFGAGASILYTVRHKERVKKLVLWNPVLDYDKTFLHAETPWGKTFFNPNGYKELLDEGYIMIPETEFRIGRQMIEEFKNLKPYEILSRLDTPVLTIHGTKDTSVPYSVSKAYGAPNASSRFISHDCDHQFIGLEDIVVKETVDWIDQA